MLVQLNGSFANQPTSLSFVSQFAHQKLICMQYEGSILI